MRRNMYKLLRIMNDINAIAKGKGGKRIMRRLFGKVSGRGIGRLFK